MLSRNVAPLTSLGLAPLPPGVLVYDGQGFLVQDRTSRALSNCPRAHLRNHEASLGVADFFNGLKVLTTCRD
jgi:hypothetical protein